MVIIDSYCEHIIAARTDGSVPALPGGLTREQFLDRLNFMIREHYAPLTIYTEADYRCGKAALLLLKKFCFSKRTYSNVQQDDAFKAYSTATLKMIDDELFRISAVHNNAIPVVNAETLFTIISNVLQLMTSVVTYFTGRTEERFNKAGTKVVAKKQQSMPGTPNVITWEREDTALVDVISYLDGAFQITDTFEKSRSNANAPRKITGEWAEFRYLSTILELTKICLDEMGVF